MEIEASDFIGSKTPPPGVEDDLELEVELELPSSDLESMTLPPTSLFGGAHRDQTGLTLVSASTLADRSLPRWGWVRSVTLARAVAVAVVIAAWLAPVSAPSPRASGGPGAASSATYSVLPDFRQVVAAAEPTDFGAERGADFLPTSPVRQADTQTKRQTAPPRAKAPSSSPQATSSPPGAVTPPAQPSPAAATPKVARAEVEPAFSDLDVNPEFDRSAAMQTLRQAGEAALRCRSLGMVGNAVRVAVTFARNGSVTTAVIEGPLSGTSAGECIASKFRPLRISSFRGSNMTVRRTVTF